MTTFLLIAAIFTFWVLTLLVRPFGRCFLCLGKGNIRRKGKRKAPKCPLCKGAKRRQRLGSRTVHRVRRTVVTGWREYRKEGS